LRRELAEFRFDLGDLLRGGVRLEFEEDDVAEETRGVFCEGSGSGQQSQNANEGKQGFHHPPDSPRCPPVSIEKLGPPKFFGADSAGRAKGIDAHQMNDTATLWNRYQDELIRCRDGQLDLWLDVSRMTFTSEWLAGMEPACQRAYADLAKLEAGEKVNADEGRMVGHYWLRDPDLAPSPNCAKRSSWASKPPRRSRPRFIAAR